MKSAIAVAAATLLLAVPVHAQSAVDAVTKAATEAATRAATKAMTDGLNKAAGTAAGEDMDKKARRSDKDGPNLGRSEEHRQDAEHRKKPKKK